MAWCIFYYAINADIETHPSEDLCSGFSDCAVDEYCAPLNHFENSYTNEDGEYVRVEEFVVGYEIKKHWNAIEVNGKKFPYDKKKYFYKDSLFKYDTLDDSGVITIKIKDREYGICRSKNKQEFKNYCGPPPEPNVCPKNGKVWFFWSCNPYERKARSCKVHLNNDGSVTTLYPNLIDDSKFLAGKNATQQAVH